MKKTLYRMSLKSPVSLEIYGATIRVLTYEILGDDTENDYVYLQAYSITQARLILEKRISKITGLEMPHIYLDTGYIKEVPTL